MRQQERNDKMPEAPFDRVTDRVGLDEDVPEQRWRGFQLPELKPLLFIIAVLLSPVFGLVFGLDFALGVLVVAMAFTTWMAWDGANHVRAEQADRLRRMAKLNAIIVVAVVLLLILRQMV